MKKYISLILALVMMVSMIPAATVSAVEPDAQSGTTSDIIFDFAAFCDANVTTRHTEYSALPMTGLALSASGTGATTGLLWETKTNPKTIRINNAKVDWASTNSSNAAIGKNNKVAFDFEVTAAGWYRPTVSLYQTNTSAATMSAYHIANGRSTYLGDVKSGDIKLNAVYLPAGTNTIVLAFVASGSSSDAFYVSKIAFAPLAEAPTGSVVASDFPTDMIGVGAEVSGLSASVSMGYGANYQFSGYGIDSSYYAVDGDSSTYLKIEAEDEGILEVKASASKTARQKGTVTYSLKGLREGTTNVTFTPVIGGAEQTAMAMTKEITVGSNELTGIELSIDKNSIYVDRTANLSAIKKWSHAADEAVSASELTFTASPSGIVSISNGVVTGLAEGTATITASLNEDPSKTDSVTITVEAQAEARTYEYVTSFDGMNTDKMIVTTSYSGKPVIRESGGKPYGIYLKDMFDWNYTVAAEYSNTGEAFPAMNLNATDKWALAGSRGVNSSLLMKSTHIWVDSPLSNMNNTRNATYIVFRVKVDAPGEYFLQMKGAEEGDAETAVYFFKEGTSGVTNTNQTTYPADSKVGYFDNGETEYTDLGKVNVEEGGDYIVAVVCDEISATLNTASMQDLAISGIKLIPTSADVLTGITLKSDKTKLTENEVAQLSATADYAISGSKALMADEVELSVSPLGVVSLSNGGEVRALATGTATITATYKADPSKTSSVEISVEIDALEGIELEANRITIYPEGEANLTVNGLWTVSPNEVIANDKFTFTSSDNNIATVSANGVVTGVAAGTVTITATHKENASLTDTLLITVKPEPNPRTHEYLIQLDVFNYETMIVGSNASSDKPTLRSAGNGLIMYHQPAMNWEYTLPAEYTTDGVEVSPLMNYSLTDKWALVGTEKLYSSARLHKPYFFIEAPKTSFGNDANVPAAYFRLKVEAPGDYILQLKGTGEGTMTSAVHFFKEGAAGVDTMDPTTYPSGSLVDYYNNTKNSEYKGIGTITVEEEGDYIIAFVCDEASKALNGESIPSMQLAAIKLAPAKDNIIESFIAKSNKESLMVGKEAVITPTLNWTYMGEQALSASDVTFESSDPSVATIDANGTVTGLATGTVTITVTLKSDTTKVSTLELDVYVPGEPRIHTYLTSKSAFEADNMVTISSGDYTNTPVIRSATNGIYFQGMMNWEYVVPAEYAKDGLAFTAMDTTEDDGDEKKTDKWAFVAEKRGRDLGALYISGSILHQFRPGDYGTKDNYVIIKIVVDAPGEYLLRGKSENRSNGAAPAVYLFHENTPGVTVTAPATYPADSKVDYFNVSKAVNYDYIGKVNIEEPGNYIVAFATDAHSKEINDATLNQGSIPYQWFSLSRLELVPADLDFLKNLEIKAETDIIYLGEELPLDITEVWEYAQNQEIPYSDLIIESSDESIATVSAEGVVTPVSQGKVKITATKRSAPEYKGEFTIEIYDPNADNIGVRYQYNVGTFSMKDQTKYNPHNSRLDESGILRDYSYMDSYDEIDETVTDLFVVNNIANVTWPVITGKSAWLCSKPEMYSRGAIFAIQTRVPVKGYYNVDIEIFPEACGALADVYIFPKGDTKLVTAANLTGLTPVGTVNFADFDETIQRIGSYEIERGGDYMIAFKLYGDNPLLDTEARHSSRIMSVRLEAPRGAFEQLGINVETLDAPGEELYFNAYRKVTFDLLDFAGNKLEGVNPEYVELNSISLTKGDGEVARLAKEVINGKDTYFIETWEVEGEAELTIDVTYRGINVVGVYPFYVADVGKTGRTLFSDARIANAQENIKNYDWAKSTRDSAIKRADAYLELGLDTLWDIVPSQGLVRIYNVGVYGDPDKYFCRYCRTYLYPIGQYYPFTVDPIKNPWKIKCPSCSRSFPSNDFGSFYELGRTQENGGKFDRIDALENHRKMLIEKGLMSEEAINMTSPGEDYSNDWYTYYGYGVKGGYLYNSMYSEVGSEGCPVLFDPSVETVERWGVDDGFGYNTGKVFPNGTEEIHTYIGYYNHFAHFTGKSESLFRYALQYLGRAYMYTGDKKYGIAGAILIDRLADNYPDYDIRPYSPKYPNNNGGSHSGRATGRIWECYVAEYLAEAYDVFWPAFELPEVIDYLHNKAVYYGMENDKSTATKIRQNVADGICRSIFDGLLTNQIHGNFGIPQATASNVAIALDHKKDTNEIIDWLYATAVTSNGYCTGGDIERKLVETIYRDGMNWESPYYNELGISDFIDVGVDLTRYKLEGAEFEKISIFEHPKYLKLVNSFQLMYLIRRGVKPMGDSGSAAYYNKYPGEDGLVKAFYATKDNPDPEVKAEAVKIAQHLYLQKGKNLKSLRGDIWTKNPEGIYEEVVDIIEEYGEYPYDKSSIMTGYGFAALRAGTLFESAGVGTIRDTTRDFTLNFSGHEGHNHGDFLDLGIEAYGIGMTTDLGYPETPNTGDPHSSQWSQIPMAHNTVVVNGTGHANPKRIMQEPLHFDAKDVRVKVMDARTPSAYSTTCGDNYRRTIVMIDYDDEISYGVDFFRVVGGTDHLYTFSPNSNDRPMYSDNLSFVKQIDEPQDTWITGHENYYWTSSYAGPTVQFGQDPNTNLNNIQTSLKYRRGYTWMFNVERGDNLGENEFWLDYQIKDFGKETKRNPNLDIRLRFTALNDFDADEVSLVSTMPQRNASNKPVGYLERFLIRRKGSNLDSLFTGVYEPYLEGERYITDIQSETLSIEKISGEGAELDAVKAVKVSLVDDRIDYIVYASNNNNTYRITDTETGYSFEFKGFVGVWTINGNGENIYSYINDGSMIGEGEKKIDGKEAAITGTVIDFQKELSLDNWVDVQFDRDLTQEEADDLVDRMMDIERDRAGNSAYMVWGVEMTGPNTARIDLDSYSTIDTYVDLYDASKGFIYDIEEGKSFTIPMSYEENGAPEFDKVDNQAVSAGSMLYVKVNATPITDDLTVTYKARNLPRGAGFDEETATFSWKPSMAQIGMNLVAIDAIDSAGRISTLYFEVEVFGSTSGGGGGGGGGGMDIPSTDDKDDEPKEEEPKEDEPTVDEPTVDEPVVDEPTVDEPTEKGFTDIANYSWAEESINYLADEGIIKGTSETTFAPQNNITRADYAILLVRAFKLESEQTENFADVNASDYFAKELAVARNTGIVGGIGDNKYAPKNTITRQDMMVILYRALTKMGVELKAVEGIDATSYADFADVADYAQEAVKALIEAGLVNGKSGLIAGSDKTTRAEVAVLLKRILDYIG